MRYYISAVGQKYHVLGGTTFLNEFPVKDMHVLHSFAYINDIPHMYEKCLRHFKSLLIDSGAFSVMTGNMATNFDLKKYTQDYGYWVREHNIENFIELDIDGVYGQAMYLDNLKRLEDIVGRASIPVWHKWRGKENYLETVKNHKFVCMGDVAVGGGSSVGYPYFNWFIDEAHKQGTKIHALGMSDASLIRNYNFDSVDSAAWVSGPGFGNYFHFNGREIESIHSKKKKSLIEDKSNHVAMSKHSLMAHVQFSKYLDEQYENIW